jgi:hypothetical protein
MAGIVHTFANYFNFLYESSKIGQESPVVNLEQDFHRYSFLKHHPEEQEAISKIFQKTVRRKEQVIRLSSLLQAEECRLEDLKILKEMGFRQLSHHPEVGLVLEHQDFPNWLIKKNYGYRRVEDQRLRITKEVKAYDFPWWMLPPHMQKFSKRTLIGMRVPNDVVHPLRVVTLERGRQWIERLSLHHIKAATEYLYSLPLEETSEKPLYERVVVISKKENILTERANMQRFVEMAHQRPNQLYQLARQIAFFIKYTLLTDTHLNNIRFLSDQTDTVLFLDGEPIGGLADLSQPRLTSTIQSFDPGFFALLGLKKLITSMRDYMESENIPSADIQRVQDIFNRAVKPIQEEIIRERRWYWIKMTIKRYVEIFCATVISMLSHMRVAYPRLAIPSFQSREKTENLSSINTI